MNKETAKERDSDVEALWQVEVDRRLEELASGRIKEISWEEVQSRLLQRLKEIH